MRRWLLSGLLAFWVAGPALAFDDLRERARGQTVFFNAWGGSTTINDYIAWAGEQLEARYGVSLEHVKLTDTADAVARVLAEKEAGRDEGGSIDLIWINGENFRRMKEGGLLFGPFTQELPNFALVDTDGKPTTLVDFTIPTEGHESPWGMAQFVMIHDQAITPEPPLSMDALLTYAQEHPGRITYPRPPDFIGVTFIKQALVELVGDQADLSQPPSGAVSDDDGEGADGVLEPVFTFLDALHEVAWRSGESFPQSGPAMHQLFEDGEIDITMAFNPAEAANLVIEGRFPETTRSYTPDAGSIANTHFLAIPFNAAHREGAMVVADFMLSPEAQARKQDSQFWGDFTVLDLAALSAEDRVRFAEIERHPATPAAGEMAPAIAEPHPEWVNRIEQAWAERYAR